MSEPFIVFDLDDTMYLERDFAFSGFRAVGNWVRDELRIEEFEATCRTLFEKGERQHVFDQALALLLGSAPAEIIARLIDVYRGHAPDISLAPDADRALRRFSARTGLITDGPSATQRAKVRALGLEGRIACILLTGELGPNAGKPSPVAFRQMERLSGASVGSLVYVADNPLKDFVTPRRRGWRTVMIERPGRIHRAPAPSAAHLAEVRLTSLDDLEGCLGRPTPQVTA